MIVDMALQAHCRINSIGQVSIVDFLQTAFRITHVEAMRIWYMHMERKIGCLQLSTRELGVDYFSFVQPVEWTPVATPTVLQTLVPLIPARLFLMRMR